MDRWNLLSMIDKALLMKLYILNGVRSLDSIKEHYNSLGDGGALNHLISVVNPKNWGVTDYTNQGDFNKAYSAARKAGEKEFMWNNKRFNTNYDGTPEQQLKETGITDDRLGIQSNLSRRAYNTISPSIYDKKDASKTQIFNFINNKNRFTDKTDSIKYSEISKQILEEPDKNKQDKLLKKANKIKNNIDNFNGYDDPYSEDGWRIYNGLPQKNNTFSISKYSPSKSKNKNIQYYALPNNFKNDLLTSTNELSRSNIMKYGVVDENNVYGYTSYGARVLGSFTLNKGKDNRGDYLSYYDKYDLSPNLPLIGVTSTDNITGKPFEIYDRVYYKDYGNGQNKRMYYNDSELQHLNSNNKNFDTLALQNELQNRGYSFPKSTNKNGELDGIYGEETKKALKDWQSKNKINNNSFRDGGLLTLLSPY